MDKLKVGILTFHASHNCGSMLQAFALQKTLEEKFHVDAELIDYSNAMSRNMYGFFDLRLKKDAIKNNFYRIMHAKSIIKSMKEYDAFSDKYLIKSKRKYRNITDLKAIDGQYDLLIAGGDQVWNVRCPDGGPEYYFSFIEGVRKVSYSASLGGTNLNVKAHNPNDYRKYLQDFEAISVREPHGKKWIEQLTGREVKIVADPTLLLSKEEWLKKIPIYKIDYNFIFNYAFFHNEDEINDSLMEVSRKTGLPVIMMDYKSYRFYKLDKYGIRLFEHTSPLSFISLMSQAKLVLTQSFHGTLFAALFNKRFWSYNIRKYNNPDDDRATAILEQIGLPSRYIMLSDLLNNDIMTDIEYGQVNLKIEELRKYSMEFINSILTKNK